MLSAVPAIEVDKLRVAYKDKPVLWSDLSFSVKPGTCLGIQGLSGCGKSTLLHCICGFIPRSIPGERTGTIRLFGRPVETYQRHELVQTIGIVFQDPETQIFCDTLEDEVAFGLENICMARQDIESRIAEVLMLTGLWDRRLSSPKELSGGQKQLLVLAAVLALRPKILLLDEGFSQLDEENKIRMLAHVAALRDEGGTVLLVDHDRENLKIADTIMWLGMAGEKREHEAIGSIGAIGAASKVSRMAAKVDPISAIHDTGKTQSDDTDNNSDYSENCSENPGEAPKSYESIPYAKLVAPIDRTQHTRQTQKTQHIQQTQQAASTEQTASTDQTQQIDHTQQTQSTQYLQPTGSIHIKDIRFSYPGDDSFQMDIPDMLFPAGSCTVIRGGNGSGKTTLGKLIAGLLKPDQGSILLDGEDTVSWPLGKIGARLGYLFQEPSRQIMAPIVREDITFPLLWKGMKEELAMERAIAALKRFSMEDLAEEVTYTLSRGEKQRLALAAILVHEPAYLLLDEPTTGLDERSKQDLGTVLNQLKHRGTGILLISHDEGFTKEYGDTEYCLAQGRVAAS